MGKTITMRHSVIIPLTILLCWAFFPNTATAQQKKSEILKPAISIKSYKENWMLECNDPDAGANEAFKGSTAYFGKLPVSDNCLDQRFLMEAKCGLSDKNKYQQKVDCFTEGPKLGAKLSSVCVKDHCEVMPDKDGDGVPDSYDNCPDKANAEQADSNSDGIGNACPSLKPSVTGELFATISLPPCETPKDMFFSEFTPSIIYGYCEGKLFFNNETGYHKKDFYIFKIDTSISPAKITAKMFGGNEGYEVLGLVEISPSMFVQRLNNTTPGVIDNKFVITSFKSKKITEYQLPELDVSSLSAKDSSGKILKKLSPNGIRNFSYDSVNQKLYIITSNNLGACKTINDCVYPPATLLRYNIDAASGNPPEFEGFILLDYNPQTMFFIEPSNGSKKLFIMSHLYNESKTLLTVVDLDKWEITVTVPSSNELVLEALHGFILGVGFVITSPVSNKIIFAKNNAFAVFDATYKLISSQDISYEKWWEDFLKTISEDNEAPFFITRIAIDTKDRLYLTGSFGILHNSLPFTRVVDLKSTLPYVYPYTLYASIPNSDPPVWPTSESELISMALENFSFSIYGYEGNNGILIQGNTMIQVWGKYLFKFFIP